MRNSMFKEYVVSQWYLTAMKLVACVPYFVLLNGSNKVACWVSLVASVLVYFVVYTVGKRIEETYRRELNRKDSEML